VNQFIKSSHHLLFALLAGTVTIGGIHCGGGYQSPQGTATAGTATTSQSFVSQPQVGVSLEELKIGDMVWAMKKDGCYYPAKITKPINERYYVLYADGEKGRLKQEKLAQWRMNPGMAVEVLQSEGAWDKAVVSSLSGENVAVQAGNSNGFKVVYLASVRVRSFPPS